jgi:glyoxylase-like metal-dependent hydrolase (beta-lactamase superfamily II)
MKMTLINSGRINFYYSGDVTLYILKGKESDLLIDTGFIGTWKKMQNWINQYNVKHVLLTHAHVDHDFNAARLQERGAKVLLSAADKNLRRNFLSQPVKPTAPKYRLRNITQLIGGALVKSKPYNPDIYLKDSDRDLLKSLGYDAEIIPLPGHTYGSIGVFSNGVLYCGDAFTLLWKKPDVTPHAVSIRDMEKSLKTILELNPKWLACGHGVPVKMSKARPVIEEYLKMKAR